jgi:hypothetical protein
VIGFYPQKKSSKDGIQRCEYNLLRMYPSIASETHSFHDSETLVDGTVIIVRSQSFLFLRLLKLTPKYSMVSFIDRRLHSGCLH